MRYLIINADGYGFTEGITLAIEKCIDFGTVRSISANVNFSPADRLRNLVKKHPYLSVGCHVNPVVGRPVLDPQQVSSLLNDNGEFFYKEFSNRIRSGHIHMTELRDEMSAQIEKARDLVGESLSHIDFHMGLHRLPKVYPAFLDVVKKSGVGRIRTHRYHMGMESTYPALRHYLHMLESPTRIPKYMWNLWLRKQAIDKGLAMPTRWIGITNMIHESKINLDNYLMMLENLPEGFNEFVAHPGYIDSALKRWSTYMNQRTIELNILLNKEFKDRLMKSDIHLAGYCDIPLKQ